MAAHIAPEAARGGPIGALSDGDEVRIDVDSRRIEVALSEAELQERLAGYTQRQEAAEAQARARGDGHVEVAIAKYAKLVGSASEGAIVR